MINHSIHIGNNNTWIVCFTIPNGKRTTRSTGIKATDSKGKTINKGKAIHKAQEIVSQYEFIDYASGNVLFCDYIAQMLERKKYNYRTTTMNCYSDILNKHITPYFKPRKVKVREIKPADLENFYKNELDKGLSPNTVKKYHTLIFTALKDAVKNNAIPNNPAERVNAPKTVPVKHTFYTTEEQKKKLWNTMQGTAIEVPVFFALFFGLRREEVLGVRWSDIDFENKTLHICNTVVRVNANGKIIDVASENMKTAESDRIFLLNDKCCNYLKQLQEKQSHYLRQTNEFIDYICVNEVGVRFRTDYITRKFSKIVKQNNLEHITFHGLRHTCISELANNSNFTMKQAQAYAGHSSYAVTANTYSHVDNSLKLLQLNALTSML